MTNDTSTLNGALNELGETLADNLSQMGVDDATANDGLTTLAGKILDIEPSIAGLELSTSIDCNVSSNKVLVGQQVVFSAMLSASYDDTSIEDIDISGVLTGATVLFKTSDGTIIGSGVTDVNGVATYTHTIEEISNITVYSEFEGSTNFSSCISSTTVTVECSYNFEVTVDKKILSANDNDIATVNCILSDSTGVIAGESIDYQILHNDTILDEGTLTTDNTGKITLEYAATGVGNVDVVFSLRSILTKTFAICDARFYDASSSANLSKYTVASGGSMTYNATNEAYLLNNGSTNWEWKSMLLKDLTFDYNRKIIAKIKFGATYNCQIALGLFNNGTSLASKICIANNANVYNYHTLQITTDGSATNESNDNAFDSSVLNTNAWYTVELEYTNGDLTAKLYNGDTLLGTSTKSLGILDATSNQIGFMIGMYGNSQAYVKDITVL